MEKKNPILFVGGIFRDLITYTSRFPEVGETLFGSSFNSGFGGKSANQSVACHLIRNEEVYFLGKVGNDENGKSYLRHFQSLGISTEYISVSDSEPTGVASIFVEEISGQNQIIVIKGANDTISYSDIERAEPLISKCSLVVIGLEMSSESVLEILKICHKHGIRTMLNAAPVSSNLDVSILKYTSILCVNEKEAETLTNGESNPEKAIKILSKCVAIVIITLGRNGALLISNEILFRVPLECCNVSVVDTTGSGDAFLGSLAFYLVDFPSLDLSEAVVRACIIASQSVTKRGTQSSYFSKKDLPPNLFQNKNIS